LIKRKFLTHKEWFGKITGLGMPTHRSPFLKDLLTIPIRPATTMPASAGIVTIDYSKY
jgi:hypothetical protein